VSQFNKRSLINSYNVTPYLKAGDNDLVIWLGSGWYSEGLPGVVGEGPMVRAQLGEKLGSIDGDGGCDQRQLAGTVTASTDASVTGGREGTAGRRLSGNLEATTLAF